MLTVELPNIMNLTTNIEKRAIFSESLEKIVDKNCDI